jgi:hypothetical protein
MKLFDQFRNDTAEKRNNYGKQGIVHLLTTFFRKEGGRVEKHSTLQKNYFDMISCFLFPNPETDREI